MELEYPFKIMLYLAVIVILTGIMATFRSKITNLCFFPPCEKEETCNVKTQPSNENILDSSVLEKYCSLCWEKNKRGECGESSVCNVVSLAVPSNPSSYDINPSISQYCSITCSRDVTSFIVQYDRINKKILIAC